MNKWILAAALILCAFGWARAEDEKTEEKEKRLTIEERVVKLEAEQARAKEDVVKFAGEVAAGLLKLRGEMLEHVGAFLRADLGLWKTSRERLGAIRAVEDRLTVLEGR